MDEGDLIQRCLDGEADAWRSFIDGYYGAVRAAIGVRCRQLGASVAALDVDDLAHDVFLHIFEKKLLSQVRSARALPYWLSIMAGNITTEFFRRTRPHRFFSLDAGGNEPESPGPWWQEAVLSSAGSEDDPRVSAMREEVRRIVSGFLERLPPRERMIMHLHADAEKTAREIAEIMGLSANTVSTIVRRTRERLKRHALRCGLEKK